MPIPKQIDWKAQFIPLPGDYEGYGGSVIRWEHDDVSYPDCSCGCPWAESVGGDWVRCRKPGGYREGTVTFEHASGFSCYESVETLAERIRTLEEIMEEQSEGKCDDVTE